MTEFEAAKAKIVEVLIDATEQIMDATSPHEVAELLQVVGLLCEEARKTTRADSARIVLERLKCGGRWN